LAGKISFEHDTSSDGVWGALVGITIRVACCRDIVIRHLGYDVEEAPFQFLEGFRL
jgi:hypothetical protein